MKFGSVCSGIEAASVAWESLGWKAAWFSEIEPFPCAVLKHHYPEVPNHGDMTTLPDRILSGEVEAPDVFCGGTPCQAFSVAGNRKSLDDARGNLSLTFCEIANAIDSVRYVRHAEPAIIFWENVPGVLNTADNAFGCFLGQLAGESCELQPPGGRWTDAGCVHGPQRTIAWRVLDAQYFSLAQRRKRVFVVASARKGFNPAEILFEFDGLRRDSAPSREARKGFAADASLCFEPRSPDGHARVIGNIAPCLNTMGGGQREPCVATPAPPHAFKIRGGCEGGGKGYLGQDEQAFTITCGHDQQVAVPIAFHPTQDPISSTNGTTHAMGCGSSGGQASIAVAVPVSGLNCAGCGEWIEHSWGWGAWCDYCGHEHDQQVAVAFAQNQLGEVRASAEVFNTLNTNSNASGRNTAMIATQYAVRRLTPIECERLQGFPDGYTNIPWRKKPEAPDGPRYKALGNSWAVPVVTWIGQRIKYAL